MISEKIVLSVKENTCGLRQSEAVFQHVVNLSKVCEKVFNKLNEKPCAIGFSISPCDFEGSYMPCFMVGKMLALSLAAAYKIKCYSFSHQRGHIMAALFSSGCLELSREPFLAFHISGGTTDLLLVKPDDEKIITVTQIGSSLDLKAGQAVDRVGVMLSLPFPCGRELEILSEKSKNNYKIKPYLRELSCSLSGVENKAKIMLDNNEPKEDIAKFCLDYILCSIKEMCRKARDIYSGLPFVFAGGVMSNKYLKSELTKEFGGYFAEPEYSSDNAAGTAILCKFAFENNMKEYVEEK